MPIASEEIKYMESTNNLGGPITTNEVPVGLHNVFDIVGGLGSLNGETNYRCLYVQNTNDFLTLLNSVLYIISNTAVETSDISIGVGTSIIGGIEQTISNEVFAPIGVTFTNQIDVSNSLSIGSIPKGSHRAIWLKRVIDPNASAFTNDNAVISVRGESAA
jgi:hypothetical protein